MRALQVIYEDNHLLVVQKPPYMPVQADSSGDRDLLSASKAYIADKFNKPGAAYLGLVHRLDRPVGGVITFARTSKAARRLSLSMQRGEWTKEYISVVYGEPPERGELCDWLVKDEATNTSRVSASGEGKEARLTYEVLVRKNCITLVRIRLLTGRHHQIRVQFSSRGWPIWGDARYNPKATHGRPIALWSHLLSFPHPITQQEIAFESLPPLNMLPWVGFTQRLKSLHGSTSWI